MDDGELPDAQRPLNELGFDSLTAVEFCNRVSQAIAHQLNPTLLFDYPTLDSLARYVVQDVLELEADSEAESADDESAEDDSSEALDEVRRQTLEEVEQMSEEEINAMVADQLGKLAE